MFGRSSAAKADNSGAGRRLLTVEIVEARNIIAAVKNGKSDPYASVALMNFQDQEIKNEAFKTNQLKDTLSPVWNKSFDFGNYFFFLIIDFLISQLFSGNRKTIRFGC
jgi:hypothetical protein